MRQEIDNPMVREHAEPLSISTQEVLASYHKPVINVEMYRKKWNDTNRRMEARK